MKQKALKLAARVGRMKKASSKASEVDCDTCTERMKRSRTRTVCGQNLSMSEVKMPETGSAPHLSLKVRDVNRSRKKSSKMG